MTTEKIRFAKTVQHDYILSDSTLDEIVLLVEEYAKSLKVDDTSARRYGFLVDNALYFWLMHGGEDKEIHVTLGRHLFTPFVSVELAGEKLDPYKKKLSDFGAGGNDIIISSGQIPEYEYRDGSNIITLSLKRERSMMREICFVAIAAIAVGILGNTFFSEALRQTLLDTVVGPIIDMFFNLLRCIAGPMVFLSVVWGVCGIGDSRMFGRIGKKVLLYSVGITALGALVGTVAFPFLGNGLIGGTMIDGELSSLFDMILSIVPSSIVDPFLTGNTLQIIFIAIAMGIALITISNKARRIIIAVDQLNLVVQHLMGVIGRLVPFIVFLLITNMLWTNSLQLISSMWKFVIAIILAFTLIAILICAITSIKQGARFLSLAKKNLSTFIVALTTASSAAAFGSNLKAAKSNYGIANDMAGFSIPLGTIVHNPIAACYNIILSIFFAASYGVQCSIGWLVVGVIVCTVVSISSPPTPGGAAVSYALLFAQMGIPEEALAVVLILDVITDFIVTAFECYVLPISLANIADSLGQLDKDILRDEKK